MVFWYLRAKLATAEKQVRNNNFFRKRLSQIRSHSFIDSCDVTETCGKIDVSLR